MANDMKTLKVIAENGTYSFPVVDQTARNAASEAQSTAQSAAQSASQASRAAATAQQTASEAKSTAQAAQDAVAGIEKVDLTGYATEDYVKNKIAEAELSGSDVDLSGYAEKEDIPTKTSQLTNDSGFLTAVPDGYVTDEELAGKGYLTEHQSLEAYAKKTDIPATLPNPNKLIFTGGATGEYDGSAAVTINIPTGGEGSGGSGPVQYVESLDESNLANLRDLATGTYVLYGYFVPFAGSSDTLTCDNTLVSVAHLAAGSHVLVFNPLNCKVNFIEILVDESADSGFTYSVQIIDMRDLPALIAAVGSRDDLATEDKSSIVAAINEVAAQLVDVPTDDHINDLINTALGVIENGTY